ncbi:acyltransferase [Pseudoroseicyclus aestuarii]|uniref:Acyltransferase 3 domain-containing protein n=1 Tax=Pseudoroseicyclus aestuarii TaxID=1795041 RepID=A0A318SYH0_9RHOB|nr:acyltransferase [Pseudoroseicyclus aestuarii]PYE85459.1 hypothetical protein DFP88_101125 [Pseudoroseicyclus aestuarii]
MAIDVDMSRQISVLRPICIFFMMTVHVNPGFSGQPHDWPMVLIGTLEVNILGRSSVAALSFISGLLLAMTAERSTLGDQMLRRLQTVYLPMVFWASLFAALCLLPALLGAPTSASRTLQGQGPALILIEGILNLFGEPVSPALGYLRDLAAASVITALILRVPRLNPGWLLPVILGLALFDLLEPLVLRPSILLFMVAGAAFYRTGLPLRVPRWAAMAGAALVLLAHRDIGSRIAQLGEVTYLTFLSHTIVISMLWMVWKGVFGAQTTGLYIVFFLGAPLVAFSVAKLAYGAIDALPPALQTAMRGKVRRRPQADAGGRGAAIRSGG